MWLSARTIEALSYRAPDELEDAIVRMIEAIPRETFLDIFVSWRTTLETCIERDGEFFEQTLCEYAERLAI
jgi:hypothetical protein